MSETMLTTKQVANYFQVTERTITQKFIKEGLKYMKIGERDYRFDFEDVKKFVEIKKQMTQTKIEILPTKRKSRRRKLNIDIEKRRINLELNQVV